MPDVTTPKPRRADAAAELSRRPGGGSDAPLVLPASESFYRALIEQTSDLVTVFDASAVIRYASPSYQRILGYTPAELLAAERCGQFETRMEGPPSALPRRTPGHRRRERRPRERSKPRYHEAGENGTYIP